MHIIRGLFLAAACLPGTAFADAAAGDVIVVTANRGERALADVIVPVTVIDRERIEQAAASDLAELLRFEAGLDIGRNGGPGQATSVFLRGTESNHTLVLVDGVRINPGTIGGAALQNIAPEVIERIEIVKGGRSSLYGTDAIGGVINIITRRAGDGYAEVSAGAGSFDTRSAYAGFGTGNEAFEVGATVNWSDTGGYAIRTDSPLERGHDNLSASLYGTYDFGSASVGLRHWRAAGTTEYLDFFLSPLAQDYRNESTTLDFRNTLGERAESAVLLSYTVDDIDQQQSADFVVSKRLSLDWQYSVDLGEHALAGGLYLTDENAEAASFGSGFDEDTRTRAVFVRDSIAVGRHRALLSARYTDHSTFGDKVTWNAEYGIHLGERWTLGAGLGHAFRAPDATDRYGFGGSVSLRPETSDETQLSAQYELSSQQRLRLELYRNDIDDLIEFDLATFTLQNIARAEIRGAQLGWTFAGDLYGVRADVVVQRAEDATSGEPLLRRPERSATLNVDRRVGRHSLGLSLLASGEREDFAATLPGYVLVNLTGQFRLGDAWQLNARLENVLDTDYQTASPYRMAERSGFVELKYRWR